MINLLWAIPIWCIFIVIYVPMILLGWILIPLAVLFGAYEVRQSQFYDKQILSFTWPIMFPWGNEEDGISAGRQYKDCGPEWKQIIYWTAVRNPVNNLRFVPILSVIVNPKKVRFIGNLDDIQLYDTKIPQWFFAWQGPYANFYWQFNFLGHLRRFWIGWVIYPTDIFGVTNYRKFGAMFTIQFKVVK